MTTSRAPHDTTRFSPLPPFGRLHPLEEYRRASYPSHLIGVDRPCRHEHTPFVRHALKAWLPKTWRLCADIARPRARASGSSSSVTSDRRNMLPACRPVQPSKRSVRSSPSPECRPSLPASGRQARRLVNRREDGPPAGALGIQRSGKAVAVLRDENAIGKIGAEIARRDGVEALRAAHCIRIYYDDLSQVSHTKCVQSHHQGADKHQPGGHCRRQLPERGQG